MTANEGTSATPGRAYAKPQSEHVRLGWPIRAALFLILLVPAIVLFIAAPGLRTAGHIGGAVAVLIVWKLLVSCVRIAAQWEKGVVLRLGRFQEVKGPGLIILAPIIDSIFFVDLRVQALNSPDQKVITKDNVPARIDGVLFFRVNDARKAVIEIQDYRFAISQYCEAALRDVVGGMSLDEVLSEREQIQERIGEVVEEHCHDWGLHVDSIRLLDMAMPKELEELMSRQASAEREKRATITKAEGDRMAAANLAEAARIMAQSPGALQLRSLQTIDSLGASSSNTVLLFPMELANSVQRLLGAAALQPTDGEAKS